MSNSARPDQTQRQPRSGGQTGQGGGERPTIAKLLQSGDRVSYFADPERRTVRPELLDREAYCVACRLQDVPSSQLRRFFGTVMGIRRRMEVDPEFRKNAEAIRAEMAFLKASAAYAAKRLDYEKPKKWKGEPLELVRFFTVHRNSVQDARDFEAFSRHFEAVVAFHKVYAPER